MKKGLHAVALLCFSVAVYALEVVPDRKDGIYASGEKIRFEITGNRNTKVRYKLQREGNVIEKTGVLEMGAEGLSIIEFKAEAPGNVRLFATDGIRSAKAGVMVSPERLSAKLREPDDFDAFWEGARASLAAVPLKVLKEKKIFSGRGADAYDVRISCVPPRPASGVLTVPRNAKKGSLPAIVLFHGAGVYSSHPMPEKALDSGALVFDVNAHGIENGMPQDYYRKLAAGELSGYVFTFTKHNRYENYFRGVFLRDLRALEYIRTRPEWNGKDIIVAGGSQGGGQALAIAALDGGVTFCAASVPAFSYMAAGLEDRFSPECPRELVPKGVKPEEFNTKALAVKYPALVRETSYYDNLFFAKRIKCGVSVAYGMVDEICPASGIMMMFNNIASADKTIKGHPKSGHGVPVPEASVKKYLGR